MSSCDASEANVPNGYIADESACSGLALENGSNSSCTLVNNRIRVDISVEKIYAQPNPGEDPEVVVSLYCPGGNVTPAVTLVSTDLGATFSVTDYPVDGMTCTVTEAVPKGYFQVGTEGCASILVLPGGSGQCSIVNDIDPDFIFFGGFEASIPY
jgi:hypothetical protein